MQDEFCLKRSEKLVGLYTRYRAELDAFSGDRDPIPYRWWPPLDQMDGVWLPYSLYLDDCATELANIINALVNYGRRLRAWSIIMATLSDDDKFDVVYEFVELIALNALGIPYSTKSRFIYAAGHLCQEASILKTGTLLNCNMKKMFLKFSDIEKFGKLWTEFSCFREKVDDIAGCVFNNNTQCFRNEYNHEFPVRIGVGVTRLINREARKGEGVHYMFGDRAPLDLGSIISALEGEIAHCYSAFSSFKALVNEQIAAILMFENERNAGLVPGGSV